METMPPPQKKRRRSDQYIPTELLEKILFNLPVKSLIRFSSVSKSWNSTIHSRDFAKRYRGREMIVFKPFSDSDTALDSPLSSILSGNLMANIPRPLPGSRVRASCGELWCVKSEDGGSDCLYNPSMRRCRKLPESPIDEQPRWMSFIYGLGYDAVTDDYKVVKFDRYFTRNCQVYSQRSNSWRMVRGARESIRVDKMNFFSKKSVFVNGLLHWILIDKDPDPVIRVFTILSFDLSTEKYGTMALSTSMANSDDWVGLGVMKGKLCLHSDSRHGMVVMWVHEEGVWSKEVVIYYYFHIFRTKEVVIDYSHIFPRHSYPKVKPLYSYNSNIKVFVVTSSSYAKAKAMAKIFLYEDGSTQLMDKDFGDCGELDSFTYVESMVKP